MLDRQDRPNSRKVNKLAEGANIPLDLFCITLHYKALRGRVYLGRGTAVAVGTFMDCYFGIHHLPKTKDSKNRAIVAFSIPELGVRFKAPFTGVDNDHCALASLLALLEFIDSNQKFFANRAYQIFGNDHAVIDQVNGRLEYQEQFEGLIARAENYRDKYRFSLEWIPTADNEALGPAF